MAVMQLLGRGTYGPRVPLGQGVSPLWQFKKKPPAQNSIIIYNDGTVKEQATFVNKEIQADNVFLFIYGGTDFRCTTESFAYEALTNAGYTWREVFDQDTFTDEYTSQYYREWEQANTRLVEDRP